MTYRIEIVPKIEDARALVKKKKIEAMGFNGKISEVILYDVYTLEKSFTKKQLENISSMLANPITSDAVFFNNQTRNIKHVPFKFKFAMEIGFLPGVTDNIANTAKEAIEDLLKIKFRQEESVYTSQLLFLKGNLTRQETLEIAENLTNPLIQRLHLKDFAEFKKDRGMDIVVPKVKLTKKPEVTVLDLNVTDDELTKIGKLGIANPDGTRRGPLALDLAYMKTVQKYFQNLGRNPNDIELESIAQTWSEHCKHTIFADPIDELHDGLFKSYIQKATEEINSPLCVSVFTDNSGAIDFDEQYLVTHKVETHNSPSALDPFGGAITGIVGVNRDAIGFGLGAKPIVNTYGFCFGNPDDNTPLYRSADLKQKLLPPRRIMDGVVEGVNAGGNCSGIPTPQGFVFFDDRYKGKPLVFVGTVGLIPKKINNQTAYIKKAKKGDFIVMVGGRVGLDGIHGATFSSEALDSGSPATAVQIGDPITQKKLSDVLIKEARESELYHSITDNGAGGLSCSVAEMAKESGGCMVTLEKVPLKYPGLDPWQIWISESQERMTLAVPKDKWVILQKLLKKRAVEATVIGEFTDSGKCQVRYHKKPIMDIEMRFLHDGLPQRTMKTSLATSDFTEPLVPEKADLTSSLLNMLARLNISGLEYISSQYDHEVQGSSVTKPLQGKARIMADATVVKPLLSSSKGIVLSQGVYPTYSDLNTYHMAACSIDTAIRNAVAAGADIKKLAILDNFCWCSPGDAERLTQLKNAAKACYEYAVAYGTPFISGKDSMFNDFKGFDHDGKPIKISIPPTLLITSLGILDDIQKAVTIDAKKTGDLVYLLGETDDELGASEYYASLGYLGKNVPIVQAEKNKSLYQAFHTCLNQNLIASAISLNRGGLAVALAKTAMAGMLGMDVSLKKLTGSVTRDDFALFSESMGRILLTINPKNKNKFERMLLGIPYCFLGKVTNNQKITVKGFTGKKIIDVKVNEALKAYKERFRDY